MQDIQLIALDIDGTLIAPGAGHEALPDAEIRRCGRAPGRRGRRGGVGEWSHVSGYGCGSPVIWVSTAR